MQMKNIYLGVSNLSPLCYLWWQHNYCKTLQERVVHPWWKHTETVEGAIWSKAEEKSSWMSNYLLAKEEVRKSTHFWGNRWEVQCYLRMLRRAGAPVSDSTAIVATKETIKASDFPLPITSCGHNNLTMPWHTRSYIRRTGFMQQKAIIKCRILLKAWVWS